MNQDDSKLPLSGLRVLAVEQYGAGPFGTSYLADLGAEVVKIENHRDGGDVGRHVGPHFFGSDDSHFFQTFNRNKKSVTLDLKHPEGMAVFQRLVAAPTRCSTTCAAICPSKLGLDYRSLKQANPRIVCAHLSAYGRSGSRRAWPGYDYLMQAEAGHMTRDRRARRAADALRAVDRRPDDRPGGGVRPARRRDQGARERRRHGRRHVALRRRAAQPQLSRHVVPERRHGDRPHRAQRPPEPRAEPALPDRGRLALHHVQQGKVLAAAGAGSSAIRNGSTTPSSPASRSG